MMLPRLTFVLLLLLITATAVRAGQDSAQRLESVQEEIDAISDDLSQKKASREEIYARLKAQSRKVSDLNRELRGLQQQISEKNASLQQLREQAGIKEKEQQQQLDALYEQMRAAYLNAEPSYLEMLLNQQDIATLSRGSTYFRYFHQARKKQLESISQLLSELNQEQKAVLLAQQSLEADKARQLEKQQALQQETEKRQNTLAALDKQISGQDARLSALRQEAQNLQSLLDKLARQREQQARAEAEEQHKETVSSEAAPVKPNTPFSRLTGKLGWPLSGKLLARYGSSRNLGKLKWQGIVIDSPTGHDVKATAAGRVVFADWLRGFGLLVIIDHGEQYMTLYGNNETLLKSAGQTVQAGEVIAQSGEQGIRGLTGLYFEIRHRGAPTNPIKWLVKQG